MADVELRGLSKAFGRTEVIHGLDLTIRSGELTVLLGPSGCGKSTLLRMIAGLEDLTGGEVLIDGEVVNERSPADRGCAMVFQNYALYPHKSVVNNIAFPLRMGGADAETVDREVRYVAGILQIDALLDRLPRDLSGGQRQRVAMGRAMIREPKVFLFDEPLSNLDAELRMRMRLEISHLQKSLGATMIFVTHDQVEAMTLADRIVVMRAGQIEQVGTPLEICRRPVNRFVASFLGMPAMNFIPLGEGGGLPRDRLLPDARAEVDAIGIRPEHVGLAGPGEQAIELPPGSFEVVGVEHLGDRSYVHLRLEHGELTMLRAADGPPPDEGNPLRLRIDPEQIHRFGADGRAIGAEGV